MIIFSQFDPRADQCKWYSGYQNTTLQQLGRGDIRGTKNLSRRLHQRSQYGCCEKASGNTQENMRFLRDNLYREVYPGLRSYSGPSPLNHPTSHCVEGWTDQYSVRNDEEVSILRQVYIWRRVTHRRDVPSFFESGVFTMGAGRGGGGGSRLSKT